MPRWEPNAKERLEVAALELYASRGYDATTVADIAGRAGVTPRTYFRYFADKREALFGGAAEIRDHIDAALREVPAGLRPLSACVQAMRSLEVLFERRGHEYLARREAVVEAAEELREREARKLRDLAAVISAHLEARGTPPGEASMVADVAVAVFVHASRTWMDDPDTPFGSALDRATSSVRALLAADS